MFTFLKKLPHSLDFKNFIYICQMSLILVSNLNGSHMVPIFGKGKLMPGWTSVLITHDHHLLIKHFLPLMMQRKEFGKHYFICPQKQSCRAGTTIPKVRYRKWGWNNKLTHVTKQYVAESRSVNSEVGNLKLLWRIRPFLLMPSS